MNIHSVLRKAAGLLVELPPEEEPREDTHKATMVSLPEGGSRSTTDDIWAELEAQVKKDAPPANTKSVEQIVRDAHGPNLDQIHVPADTPPPTATPDGKMDFTAIYRKAGLTLSPFTAEQTLEMIASLPAELPLETRRQTVRVTINAMGKAIGATAETVVADASTKLAALSAYAESVGQQTGGLLKSAEEDIAVLQAQIEEKRKAMLEAQQLQGQVLTVCQAEAHRLEEVLEFFSLDVPPSKFAPGA
jgi:hypothetical protein